MKFLILNPVSRASSREGWQKGNHILPERTRIWEPRSEADWDLKCYRRGGIASGQVFTFIILTLCFLFHFFLVQPPQRPKTPKCTGPKPYKQPENFPVTHVGPISLCPQFKIRKLESFHLSGSYIQYCFCLCIVLLPPPHSHPVKKNQDFSRIVIRLSANLTGYLCILPDRLTNKLVGRWASRQTDRRGSSLWRIKPMWESKFLDLSVSYM